jgi:hypothetical protein
VSSSNPHQTVYTPIGNHIERAQILQRRGDFSKKLSSRRTLLHRYALQKHYELKYSNIAGDIFSRLRERIDPLIGKTLETSIQKFSSIYENLQSENPEDWSNAVHSCRRILQDLADVLYPARDDKIKTEGDKEIRIKLGNDNYINRLMSYIETKTDSSCFEDVVGSHIKYIGERLDAIFNAAQKGSHSNIVTREEADRYVVYTYLTIGDILSL